MSGTPSQPAVLQSAVVLIIRENPERPGMQYRQILTVTHQVHGGIGLPGGKVEQGETVEQAAIRELREETALQCELRDLHMLFAAPWRFVRRDKLTDPGRIAHLFIVRRAVGTPRAAEAASKIEWVDWESLIHRSPFGSYYLRALPVGISTLPATAMTPTAGHL